MPYGLNGASGSAPSERPEPRRRGTRCSGTGDFRGGVVPAGDIGEQGFVLRTRNVCRWGAKRRREEAGEGKVVAKGGAGDPVRQGDDSEALIGRTRMDDALRLETVNGYSSVGDFREVAERLRKFLGK